MSTASSLLQHLYRHHPCLLLLLLNILHLILFLRASLPSFFNHWFTISTYHLVDAIVFQTTHQHTSPPSTSGSGCGHPFTVVVVVVRFMLTKGKNVEKVMYQKMFWNVNITIVFQLQLFTWKIKILKKERIKSITRRKGSGVLHIKNVGHRWLVRSMWKIMSLYYTILLSFLTTSKCSVSSSRQVHLSDPVM